MAPASRSATFFALAVSASPWAQEPACPNCTSDVNIFAHVPMHQATMGLLRVPVASELICTKASMAVRMKTVTGWNRSKKYLQQDVVLTSARHCLTTQRQVCQIHSHSDMKTQTKAT